MKHRFNLELSSKSMTQINRAKQLTDAPSYTEVIRRAIAVYAYTLECIQNGAKMQHVHPDGKIETINPYI